MERQGTIISGRPDEHDFVVAYKDRGRDSWQIRRGTGGGELIGVVAKVAGRFAAYRDRGGGIQQLGSHATLVDAGRAVARAAPRG